MNNLNYFIGCLFIFIGTCFFFVWFFIGDSYDEVVKVKCYDRYGNEIIGATCLEKHNYIFNEFFVASGFLMIMFGVLLALSGGFSNGS